MIKSVIITGCSSGIGQETLNRILGTNSYKIYACYRKTDDVSNQHIDNQFLRRIELDLNDDSSVSQACDEINSEIDTNNEILYAILTIAGISYSGPIEIIPISDIHKIFRVNVISYISIVQYFLKHLRKSKGKIILLGSYSGRIALPYLSPYAMTKYALEAFTDSLRMELKRWEIDVIMIESGNINTSIWEKAIQYMKDLLNISDSEQVQLYTNHIKRLVKTTDDLSKRSLQPSVIAGKIVRILNSKRNKTRYKIGFDSYLMIYLSKLLPDRMKDRVLLNILGLRNIEE